MCVGHNQNPQKPKELKAPLGNNAELSPPPSSDETVDHRIQRYFHQYEARNLLLDLGARQGLEHKANVHRMAKCMYIRHSEYVKIQKSRKHGKAFFAGLIVCGNAACPVCAAKIEERRRIEIARAFDWAYHGEPNTFSDDGVMFVEGTEFSTNKVIMITFTFPHSKDQKLKDLLAKQSEAFKFLRKGKAWDKAKKKMGYVGLIRSLEITIGDNGWHPHTHEAWIVDKDCDASWLKEFLINRWLNCCEKAGIKISKTNAFRKHSVDVMDNAKCSDYLAKQDSNKNWGVDRELAKGAKKVGQHPFSLLTKSADGDKAAGKKFLEYVFAIKGRPRILWSRGLKKMVGVNELTDLQIAERQEDEAMLMATLNGDDWAIIMKSGRAARPTLLDLAENGCEQDIRNYINSLAGRKPVDEIEVEVEVEPEVQRLIDFGESIKIKPTLDKLSVQAATRIQDFIHRRIRR